MANEKCQTFGCEHPARYHVTFTYAAHPTEQATERALEQATERSTIETLCLGCTRRRMGRGFAGRTVTKSKIGEVTE
jgi:hypothetical protein